MKKIIYIVFVIIIGLTSCRDNDVQVFDKTADERVSEAVAALKQDLVSAPNGWILKYRPTEESGAYYVFLNFAENNTVSIKSDLGTNNGEFFDQTITYRIDNSLGLELILESYSFFTSLFEEDQATFQAEYEFLYVNKTPNNDLVFRSKSDVSSPTILLFQQAAQSENEVLGRTLGANLDKFNKSINRFSVASSKLTYLDRDIVIYLTLDVIKRTANFNYIATKNDLSIGRALSLSTGYVIKRDSIVFDTPLQTAFQNVSINLDRLYFNGFSETTVDFCSSGGSSTPSSVYNGLTSSNDKVALEPTLINNNGASFRQASEIYIADIRNIFDENGESVSEQVTQDITGAEIMVMYNGANSNLGTLNALGFYIENADGSNSIAVKRYTPTFTGNVIEFAFEPEITFVRNPDTPADVSKMDIYLDKLTQGGKTYVFQINEQFYELYNPCSGWSFAFQIL